MAAMGMITPGICNRRNGFRDQVLHSSNLEPRMSQLGQTRPRRSRAAVTGLLPKAAAATRDDPSRRNGSGLLNRLSGRNLSRRAKPKPV
jgi:hypothetical protein